MTADCDLCVIGGGEAGLSVTQAGVALGLKVVLIDSGTSEPCWRNWDVALAVLRAAAEGCGAEAEAFGVFRRSLDRALRAAAPDRRFARLEAMNVGVIRGRARFAAPDRVVVDGRNVRARRFVLATGMRPSAEDLPVLGHAGLIERLRTGATPSAFVGIGGDERAVALALGLARLGVGASLDASGGLLPQFDPEFVALIERALRARGVSLIRSQPARNVGVIEERTLVYRSPTVPALSELDPSAADLDLRDGGLCLSPALRTTNPRVYAVGGVAGARSSQAVQAQVGVVLRSAFFHIPGRYDPAAVPRGLDASPGIAAVGLDEKDARERGPVTVWRWPLAETAAGAAASADGFVKIVADRRGTVLGAGLVGSGVIEQVAFWTMAVRARTRLNDIATLPLPGAALADASRRAATQFLAQKLRQPVAARALALLRWLG